MPDPGPDYEIIVRPLPGFSAPPVVRLRRALKCLARSFGLACRSVREIGPPAAPAGPGQVPGLGGGPVRGADGKAAAGQPDALLGVPGEE
jgi:hypothetical protein